MPHSAPADSNSINDMIREARRVLGNSNKNPEIVGHMVHGSCFKRIKEHDAILRVVMRAGLDKLVREFLKHIGNQFEDEEDEEESESVTVDQLDLWPEDKASIIAAINRKRVKVPSRNEFVYLDPHQISRPECREAGQYKITKGAEAVRCGRLLIRLSELPGPWA